MFASFETLSKTGIQGGEPEVYGAIQTRAVSCGAVVEHEAAQTG